VDAGGRLLAETLDVLQVLGELLVHQVGQVAAIVQDHVQGLAVGEDEGLLDAPQVLLVRLALPGVHGHSGGSDGRRSVILGAEDVAAGPLDLGMGMKSIK